MDLCDFLSQRKNYESLVKKAREVIRSYGQEEVYDIISEALVLLLDYFKRNPGKLLEIEQKESDEMFHILKVALRNRVFNILNQRNKEMKKILEHMKELTWEDEENTNIFRKVWSTGIRIFRGVKNQLGFVSVDINEFTLEKVEKDIYFFIEEKYGREKWNLKKEAIKLYIERFLRDIPIPDMQELYPGKNIASLNTDANRTVRKYLKWLKQNERFKRLGINNLMDYQGSAR